MFASCKGRQNMTDNGWAASSGGGQGTDGRRTRRRGAAVIGVVAALAAIVLVPAATPVRAASTQVPITSVAGFPNGRTLNDLPPNAIDGDINTFTWTTNPNNTASPSHLA